MLLTVTQALNLDPAEVQRGCHTYVERTLRDGVSSVTHGDGQVSLPDTQTHQSALARHSALRSRAQSLTCCAAV